MGFVMWLYVSERYYNSWHWHIAHVAYMFTLLCKRQVRVDPKHRHWRSYRTILYHCFIVNLSVGQVSIHPEYSDNREAALGINWTPIYYDSPALSFPAAVAKGAGEAWNTLTLTLRSFGLLFKGIDLTQAVSGPVRITYMMGDVAAEGFGQSVGSGFRSLANFLALISIALCVMNLLPLPVLDGGMIILCIIEMIRRKPLNPKAASVFQAVGVVFIAGLMLFAVFGDILYLIKH